MHLPLVRAYARRRGAADADAIAADVMTVAWRRLGDIPRDDPRGWLIGVARNLMLAERRQHAPSNPATLDGVDVPDSTPDPTDLCGLDPELESALNHLPAKEREALLLVAWEDLSSAQAALSLGITAATFRVRLHRARRRLARELPARYVLDPADGSRPNLEAS